MNPGKACPTCGAAAGRACISESGERSGKIHVARKRLTEVQVEKHTPLPDLSAWWREQRELERRVPRKEHNLKKVIILLLGLASCPIVRAQNPIMPQKSLIRVAHPGALAMPGMAMPSSPFPNTYSSDAHSSFDPNTGSAGTLYLNYHFTGTTQPNPMCNANTTHHPMVWVFITKNGTKGTGHFSQGTGIAPCVQMDQTLTVAFDLASDQCTLSLLIDGTCGFAEQDDQVYCAIAGSFAFFIKNWQFEGATTVSQVVDGSPGAYFLEPYCAASSDPPDWFGPFGSVDYGTGYWVATEAMIRWQIFGKSFYGVPWKALSPVGPAGEWAAGPKPICTMYDHGCSFVDQTCTAGAIPAPNPYEPDVIEKRRNA